MVEVMVNNINILATNNVIVFDNEEICRKNRTRTDGIIKYKHVRYDRARDVCDGRETRSRAQSRMRRGKRRARLAHEAPRSPMPGGVWGDGEGGGGSGGGGGDGELVPIYIYIYIYHRLCG